MIERRIFVAGEWRATGDVYEVRSPASGDVVARAHRARPSDVQDAIAAAVRAFERTRVMPTWERTAILGKIGDGLARRRDELVRILALEAGKPVAAGRAEVDRAIFTVGVAAEEARRLGGELLSMDWAPWGAERGGRRMGIVRRFPIGPISAIVPFNFPLNLALHKIAPAIASGNTMVLKPASQTPSCTAVLAELAQEAGLPGGALNVIPSAVETASPLATDERLKMLTFTGSAAVGWDLKARAGRKKVCLELGGNAAAVVLEDADLGRASTRIAAGGYSYAGQSCISVQRVIVHKAVYERFVDLLVAKVKALKFGDPLDETTEVGPMISEAEAARALAWVKEAESGGARILTGGTRNGAVLEPTVMAGVKPEMKLSCQEVFAPVVAVGSCSSLDEALDLVNHGAFGLQAGIFTRHAPSAWKAFERLDVGGVMIDDIPGYRVDHMPYGGVKQSGLGREGPKYAIEEMTELKILGWHLDNPLT